MAVFSLILSPQTEEVGYQIFSFDGTITIGDGINAFLLILTVIGLVFTVVQLMQTKKINRAELVKELYLMLYDDEELRDVFYKIEWSDFSRGEIDIQDNEFERKADKLLSFFEVLCSMYFRGIITKADMALFDYELKRVYAHPDVQAYFAFLEEWQEDQELGESFVNYQKYCSKKH